MIYRAPWLPVVCLALAGSIGCSDVPPESSGSGPAESESVEAEAEAEEQTDQVPATEEAEAPSEEVAAPTGEAASEGELSIANPPPPCAAEPPLQELPLPASMRVAKNNASLGLVQISAGGDVSLTPAEGADPAALRQLELLIERAQTAGQVAYRYVERPDRGGGGGENCLGTTSLQSPRFASAFGRYVRSYDIRWFWDPAYRP